MGMGLHIVASCIVLILLALALANGEDTKPYLSSKEIILPENFLNFQKIISNAELEADKESGLFNLHENNLIFNAEMYKNFDDIISLHGDAGKISFSNLDIPSAGSDIDIDVEMLDIWNNADFEAISQEQGIKNLFKQLIDQSNFQKIDQQIELPDIS